MEHVDSFGLTASGKVGAFTVDVLRSPAGRWLLSIESPTWCFDFELTGPTAVCELAAFFRSHIGRAQFGEQLIGSFGDGIVRIIKDDEFEDRFFLRAFGNGALVEITLIRGVAEEFAAAVAQAAVEFDA